MKKLLVLIFFILWPSLALALNCECSSTCDTATSTNWSCAVAPDANDDIEVLNGGVVSWSATQTFDFLVIRDGGTFNCTASAGSTLTFDNDFVSGATDTFLRQDEGSTINCSGAYTMTYTGAKVGIWFAGGASSSLPVTDANITWRGVERVVSQVAEFSEGTTTGTASFDDCIEVTDTPTSTIATGDTVVFTSGLSDEFWYTVTGVGNVNDCTTFGGAAGKTFEITRDDTGAAWNSMALAGGAGGPELHATPVDTDADGVAESDGTRPGVGDTLAVFLPIKIAGPADPTSAPAIRILWEGVALNVRYMEAHGLGNEASDCADDNGGSAFHIGIATSTAPEGDVAFVNVYDWGARIAYEFNRTDDTVDARPNYPITYRHFYLHDASVELETCNGGSPPAHKRLGGGISITTDNGTDTYLVKNMIFEGMHIARTYNSPFVSGAHQLNTTRGIAWEGVRFRDFLLHDSPRSTAYPLADTGFSAAFVIQYGTDMRADGIAIWNIGNLETTILNAIKIFPRASQQLDGTINDIKIFNIFLVNFDNNSAGASNNNAAIHLAAAVQAPYDEPTGHNILTNSYIANVVASGTQGGSVLFNYFENINLEDDGVGCSAARRHVMFLPTEAIGNVMLRTSAGSCNNQGINIDDGIISGTDDALTDRTRKIISNVTVGLFPDPTQLAFGIYFADGSGSPTYDVDIYNNVFDFDEHDGSSPTLQPSTPTRGIRSAYNTSTNTVNMHYNIIMNSGEKAIRMGSSGSWTLDYNRAINAFTAIPFTDNGSTDISGPNSEDNDAQDVLVNPANYEYGIKCDSSYLTGNPWGGPRGPLWFGIRSFAHFHPAVLRVMDPKVFRMQWDWRSCGLDFKTDTPR